MQLSKNIFILSWRGNNTNTQVTSTMTWGTRLDNVYDLDLNAFEILRCE